MASFDSQHSVTPIPQAVELVYGLYPGVEFFSPDYGAEDHREWVDQSNGDPVPAPLAVYIQDVVQGQSPPIRGRDISSSRRPAVIEAELRLQGELFDSDRPVQQLICSTGIATEWTDDQLYELVSVLQSSFNTMQNGLANWCACVGRIAPPESRLRLLRVLGFTNLRLSICDEGKPDEGTLDHAESLAVAARRLGMRQVALDMHLDSRRTPPSSRWLEGFLLRVQPDRLRLMHACGAGGREVVRTLREASTPVLAEMGYHHIGLDWFVRSGDAWWQARRAEKLNWSLLGFTDMPRPDVIGIGPGAVSSIGDFCAQNTTGWEEYQRLLNQRVIPAVRGLALERDDVLRREIMAMMLTASRIDIAAVEEKWGIEFRQFFAAELGYLKRYEQSGWVSVKPQSILVEVRGRSELTELCRIFDRRSRTASDSYTPSIA
jgi:oxygen-independent coproporphyrinogen-3 oxidase